MQVQQFQVRLAPWGALEHKVSQAKRETWEARDPWVHKETPSLLMRLRLRLLLLQLLLLQVLQKLLQALDPVKREIRATLVRLALSGVWEAKETKETKAIRVILDLHPL